MIENRHQSDLTVRIFSVIHAFIDYEPLEPMGVDNDGCLSEVLSGAFRQTWLVSNSFGAVKRHRFHADYLTRSAAVRDCFASVVCVAPTSFCETKHDVEAFVGSVLAINEVFKRRVLFLLPPASPSAGDVPGHYYEVVGRFLGAKPGALAHAAPVTATVVAVSEALRRWLAS